MSRFRTLAVGLLLGVLEVTFAAALAAQPWIQNSQCLNTGKWLCNYQGKRECNWKVQGNCTNNTCILCNIGPSSLPSAMCFMSDGSSCQQGGSLVTCARRYPTSKCVPQPKPYSGCTCQGLSPYSGYCVFTNCNGP